MTKPRFAVGQIVRRAHQPSRTAATSYTIAQVMPFEGDHYEYRIKGDGDSYLQVAKEYELREDESAPSPFR